MEFKTRSVIKTITWRLYATLFLFVITGSLKISICYMLINSVVYFIHERIWNKISWGKPKGLFVAMTGLSGAGKSTLAMAAQKILENQGYKVEVIDGDEYRRTVSRGLGFSREDRKENIQRLAFVADKLAKSGDIVILAAINPYNETRNWIAKNYPESKLVHIHSELHTVIDRDPKGLYQRALLPKEDPNHIPNFTGVSDPFERPNWFDLRINTGLLKKRECVNKLVKFIKENI